MLNRGLLARLFLQLLLGLLLVPASPSQTHPASYRLEITVNDENGVAVNAALTILTPPPPIRPLRGETDFAGHCAFVNLPAGTYQLQVEKLGFYASTVAAMQPETTANVEVVLSHQQEIREVVNVSESAPVIDPAQVSSREQLTGLDIIDIPYPATHDYRNVLNFIPGVVQDTSGQPHIAGAETYQTLTVLDGFNVTQPANGLLLIRVSTDAFRSIDVEPSREPAEFGKGSGGVLSLSTGIGDDHFRFISTDFTPSLQDKKGIAFDQWTPRFTLSGPIYKGKAWFFDALDGEYDNFIVTQLPSGADTDRFWRIGNLAKVQTNLTSRNILTTSFLYNHLQDPHSGLSPLQPLEVTPSDIESAYVGTIRDQHYFAGRELLELGFNVDQYNLALTPLGNQPYDLALNAAGGNYYLNSRTHARRSQALSNLYLPSHSWHGRHDVKVGVDFDRIDYDARFLRQPISFLSAAQPPALSIACPTDANGIPILPSPCLRYSVFSGGNYSTTYNSEVSAYAEDRWLVNNRFLLEPGLRLDWDQVVRSSLVSPRLAGTYVLDNAATTKISAGVGIIYDATDLILIARPFAGVRTDYFLVDSAGAPLPPGSPVPPVTSSFLVDRGALQAPRFLNWSAALEKKLPAAVFLKVEFLERRSNNDFAYNTPANLPAGQFLLQNSRHDRYDAIQFSLRHNFRQHYLVMGSYTRSRAHSTLAFDFNVDNPILSPQAPGPFSWDAPNRFLSWGYVPFFKLPLIHALDLAYSAEARTGFPFSVNNDLGQIVGSPGSYRFPAYFALNLQLEKRFHLFGYYWALRGGFDNITNRSNPYVVNTDVNSSQFLTFSGYDRRAFTSRIRFLGRK